jgi:hypothetical protein
MKSNLNIIKKAENFLDQQTIEYVKPGVAYKISAHEVEVIFKHPLYNAPDYIICPDEYRVVVNLEDGSVRWGFQM